MKKAIKASLALVTAVSMVASPAIINAEDSSKASNDSTQNTKEETVYVIKDADGNTSQTIVSDWLKNNTNASTLADACNLKNVVNVKSKAKYSTSEGVNTWKANGKDIYYQGDATTSIPVNVSISYKLDGKEVKAADLLNKSGNVSITVKYSSDQSETVDGSAVQVPFMMVTGMVMDNSRFSNVKIDNGKVINDGDRTVAVGYGVTGVNESLDQDVLPESFTLTAKVKKFQMSDTMTYASNEALNNVDLSNVSSMSDLESKLDLFGSSANQLESGSSQLADGLNTLNASTPALVSGVSQLAAGGNELSSGSTTLASGADQVSSGASTLYSKSQELATGATKVSSGATQLYNAIGTSLSATNVNSLNYFISGMAQLNAGINTGSSTTPSFVAGMGQLDAGIADLITKLTAATGTIATAGNDIKTTLGTETAAVQTIAAQLKTISTSCQSAAGSIQTVLQDPNSTLSAEARTNLGSALGNIQSVGAAATTIQQNLLNATHGGGASGNIEDDMTQIGKDLQTLANAMPSNMSAQLATLKSSTDQLNTSAQTIGAYMSKLNAGTSTIKSNIQNIQTAVGQIADGANQVTDGSTKLSTGTGTLASGAAQVSSGSAQVSSGASTLSSGLNTLNSSTGTLSSGVSQLSSGANELAAGMKEFNEDGVQKIMSIYNGSVKSLVKILSKSVKASKEYSTYSGLSSNMSGSVKYVIKTDGIQK